MKAVLIFKKNIARAENLFSVHRQTFKRGRPRNDWPSDILRASLIFSTAAFDAYMHDKILEIMPVFLHKKKSKLSSKFISLLKEAGLTYEKLLTVTLKSESVKPITRLVKEYYSKRTIQDINDIERVINIFGISDFWYKLAQAINRRRGRIKKLDKESVKDFVRPYMARRHQIVHEADLEREDKPRLIKISFVKTGLRNIKLFTEKVEKILEEKFSTN